MRKFLKEQLRGVCAVLSPSLGEGWNCQSGDARSFAFEVYPQSRQMGVGYIRDGLMYDFETFSVLSSTYQLEITEDGAYQIYVISGASDYLALKEGQMTVEGPLEAAPPS